MADNFFVVLVLHTEMEKLLPNETKTETSETCKDQPATGRKEAA